MRLSHADYTRVNEAVAAMYRLAYTGGAAAAITQTLTRVLGGVNAVAGCLRGPQVVEFAATEPEFAAVLIATTPQIARLHPRFTHVELAGSVLLVSDFLSRRAWEGGELFAVGWGSLPYADDLGVNAVLENGSLMSVALMREGRTFREEDLEMFALLLPHMQTLFSPPPSPGVEALGGLGLTKREQEVLFWVSEGKKNSEAAEILGIAPGTVKRHLENLYVKLGVETRHGAALKAMEKLRRFH